MNCFKRPYIQVGAALLGIAVTLAPGTARAQLTRIAQIIEEPSLLLHTSSQGYLGVLVGDVDTDSAAKLKLKETRGAVITLIDHDAPAAQVGLRVNDVLLEVNGQTVESAEAFGRMMREIPPGRKITLLISRDGATQTLTVELADRKKLDTDIWNKLNNDGDFSSPAVGLGMLGTGGGGDAPLPGGFHMPFVGSSTVKLGALVEPLTAQMADYLGVANGLMVKSVGRKSQAAAAGMKAFDVILKVGTDNIATVSDWDRAIRANQGKTVAVTILRDKKQQTLTLLVDSKKKGEVEFEDIFGDEGCPLMAFADSDALTEMQQALQISPEQLQEYRKDSEQFRDAFKDQRFGIDQQQLDQLKQQMQQFNKNFATPEQLDQLHKQMEQWQQSFDPNKLGYDWTHMDELQRQIQQMRQWNMPSFDEQQRKEMERQMDRLKRQMEEMQALGFDHLV
jgi:serine protease Do